jgi:hypothetical protein
MAGSIGSCRRDSTTIAAMHADIPTNGRVEVADKSWAEPAKNQLAKKAPKTPTSSRCFHTKLEHNPNQITDRTGKEGVHSVVEVDKLTFLVVFSVTFFLESSLSLCTHILMACCGLVDDLVMLAVNVER